MNNEKVESLFSKKTWAVIGVIGTIGSVFLVWSHTSHILSIVPYLILLLCPLMHIFMHKAHGHAHDGRHHKRTEQ